MSNRRGTYFAFQGLLMAVLVLLAVLYYRDAAGWGLRIALLIGFFTTSLVVIQRAPARRLEGLPLQTGLFISDAVVAFLVLLWTGGNSVFYLLFVVVLFGSALTRRTSTSIFVAVTSSILYFTAEWQMAGGFPDTTGFWLRIHFLWIMTFLMAILARDGRQAQQEAEERYQMQLAQLESLATLGQVAGEVAHRIKGPLTTIRVNTEVLAQREDNAEKKKELSQVQEEVDHIKTILKDLLDLGRLEEVDFAKIDLRAPLKKALESISGQAKAKGVQLAIDISDIALTVRADESLMLETFSALLQNAVEATEADGHIWVAARHEQPRGWFGQNEPPRHLVRIGDDGAGIAKDKFAKLFRPFFTTKGAAGNGLGLAAALRIIQLHHGTIEPYSDGPNQGAEFIVRLPAL